MKITARQDHHSASDVCSTLFVYVPKRDARLIWVEVIFLWLYDIVYWALSVTCLVIHANLTTFLGEDRADIYCLCSQFVCNMSIHISRLWLCYFLDILISNIATLAYIKQNLINISSIQTSYNKKTNLMVMPYYCFYHCKVKRRFDLFIWFRFSENNMLF